MTNGERKALAFLAAVAVLGAAARVTVAPPRLTTREDRVALAGQLDAVDSARRADRAAKSGRGAKPARRPARRPARARAAARPPGAPPAAPAPAGPVDVDAADLAALESLPGIGPGLARRIAEERAERGAFGSLSGLQRVRGVGPKLAQRLAPHVTFSGIPRPSSAAVVRPP